MRTTPFVALVTAGLGGLLAPAPVAAAPGQSPATPPPDRSVVFGAPDAEHPYCATRVLSPEALGGGATSRVACYAEPATESSGARGRRGTRTSDVVLAIHHTGSGGTGASLEIWGADCGGGGVSLGGTGWDDVISSTHHQLCSKVKHFQASNFTGANQITEGGTTSVVNLTGAYNDSTSSITYLGPVN